MAHDDASAMFERSVAVVEGRAPEMADGYLEVPLAYYTEETWAARERHLFMTQPRALLAASEIAEPDDYFVRFAMGRSILLTRDREGVAHAFLNYCRHRGAEPARGCGNAARLSCPYHAWTYDTKGALVGMPLRDRNASLDYGGLGLVELPSEERHGFIWVVLTPGHPIDVAAHLGEAVDAQLAALGCTRWSYYNSLPHEPLSANWKNVSEGLVELLHVPFVHRETFDISVAALSEGQRHSATTAWDLAFYDRYGPHVRFSLPQFGHGQLGRARAEREAGRPVVPDLVTQVWLLSPGVLLAQEGYGLIFADLEPGPSIDSTLFRYGWMSPVREAPPNCLSPEEMALRAAAAVREDAPVWQGCARGMKFGGHEYALVGKNEKGVQLFHEALAAQTGYEGLRYSER